jgi:hypothetical protein
MLTFWCMRFNLRKVSTDTVLQFNASVSKAKFDSAEKFSSGGPGYHSFPQMQREYAHGPGPIINPSLSNPFAVSSSDNLRKNHVLQSLHSTLLHCTVFNTLSLQTSFCAASFFIHFLDFFPFISILHQVLLRYMVVLLMVPKCKV